MNAKQRCALRRGRHLPKLRLAPPIVLTTGVTCRGGNHGRVRARVPAVPLRSLQRKRATALLWLLRSGERRRREVSPSTGLPTPLLRWRSCTIHWKDWSRRLPGIPLLQSRRRQFCLWSTWKPVKAAKAVCFGLRMLSSSRRFSRTCPKVPLRPYARSPATPIEADG